jgi:hypothetical protein
MTEAMNELFQTKEQANAMRTAGVRALAGTDQLVDFTLTVANKMLQVAGTQTEDYKDRILASQSDNVALDALIADMTDEQEICGEIEVLKLYSPEVLLGMLKSQQSKRSRARHSVMTQDNYKSLVSAAIAEKVLRGALGKNLTAHSAGGTRTGVGRSTGIFTEDELVVLKEDQMRLRAEIRNVQSKKSVAKKTEGYEETDHWKLLLEIEAQLMGIRDSGFKPAEHSPKSIVQVDRTKEELAALLAGKDISKMKAADKVELLKAIEALTEEPVAEDTENKPATDEVPDDAASEL